ncbi:MAG: hypothetical protein ACXW2X_10685 [Thermoanaerobaculia bacterium]
MRAMCVISAFLLAACASQPPAPVLVDANPYLMTQLAGKWVGDYSSPSTGRSGSIVFNLSGDRQSAQGDVIMYSTIVNVPGDPATVAAARGSHAADVLSISFVRAADSEISGKLAPYRDPNTGATVSTTFTGRMIGDTIEGNFQSVSSDANAPQHGRWRVRRQ